MGTSLTSITLRSKSATDVAEWFRACGRTAYISEEKGECIIVCDEACEEQDLDVLAKLGSELSHDFRCAALVSLVHDSDVLVLILFENGHQTMNYNSAPMYFENVAPQPPKGADPIALCLAFHSTHNAEVGSVLSQWCDPDNPEHAQDQSHDLVFEEFRLKKLAILLGVPAIISQVSFVALQEGIAEDLGDECPAFQLVK